MSKEINLKRRSLSEMRAWLAGYRQCLDAVRSNGGSMGIRAAEAIFDGLGQDVERMEKEEGASLTNQENPHGYR